MKTPRILFAIMLLGLCNAFAQNRPGGFSRDRQQPPRNSPRPTPGPRQDPLPDPAPVRAYTIEPLEHRLIQYIYEYAEISWQVKITKHTPGTEMVIVTVKFLDADGFVLHETQGFQEMHQGQTVNFRELTRVKTTLWHQVRRVNVSAF